MGDAKGGAAGAAEANNALSAAKGVVASRVNVRCAMALQMSLVVDLSILGKSMVALGVITNLLLRSLRMN